MNDAQALIRRKKYYRTAAWLTLVFVCVLAGGILIRTFLYPAPIGPEQPIPFSHKVHANEKNIGCLVCHPEAAITATAGIPPLQRCMHCHSRIIMSFAPILDLKKHYESKTPVEWKRVVSVPDFVYFPHSVHLYRSVDCAHCHGDIKAMDRIMKVHEINMGFCMSCHRDYNAPVDCFTCHR